MNITIDTSTIIAVIANEQQKSKIAQLTVDVNLIAPVSVHWEIGNAFSAMLKRNRITALQAKFCIQAYQKIPIKLIDVDLVKALEIADKLKTYAYDAYLVQCALQTKTPLLSLDSGLIQAAKSAGITIME